MSKEKSLHLTPKQLGLADNPMIHDKDPLASDSGNTEQEIGEDQTPEGGVIRLSRWPEGYVLWYHGAIVWKSWS